jgi:beta-glucosidase
VRRILWLKETIGLFDDHTVRWTRRASEPLASPRADALSRDAARRSIVLLNNRDNVLPLQKTGQKIRALIGPFVQDR